MIVTELYNGQGLGNQLWCYVATRVISLDNNYKFGIMSPEKFKGSEFMKIYFGEEVNGGCGPEGGPPEVLPESITQYYNEKKVIHNTFCCDIRPLDLNLVRIKDNTKIDGIMQAEDYIFHRREEIIKWMDIDKEKNIMDYSSDNICVIHFRGGDFVGADTTLLPVEYYSNAMDVIREENNDINFVAVTDDPTLFRQYFPKIEIVGSSICEFQDSRKAGHHVGGPIWMDYTVIKNAQYLILSNSSFSWWAAWTNLVVKKVIAPKYWARHNISNGFWSTGDSLTREWDWLDRDGNLFNYEECLLEKLKNDI